MRYTHLFALVVCSALMGACNREPDQGSQNSVSTEEKLEDAQKPSAKLSEVPENINPAVVLEATPNPMNMCDGSKLGTVDIRWDVSAASPSSFSIWVAAPGQQRKLWMTSKAPTGSNRTGNWVRDQTKFWLVDDKGVVIASIVVAGGACSQADESATAKAQ